MSDELLRRAQHADLEREVARVRRIAQARAIVTVRRGDRVRVLDAPAWCRRYLAGQVGRVVRVMPLAAGDVWVRFDRPVDPWCDRMDPVVEFPFSPDQLSAA
jgi:hypothetical protein